MGLGCIAAGAKQITPDIMLAAAKAAATKLTPQELEQDSILPDVNRIRCAGILQFSHTAKIYKHMHACLALLDNLLRPQWPMLAGKCV